MTIEERILDSYYAYSIDLNLSINNGNRNRIIATFGDILYILS